MVQDHFTPEEASADRREALAWHSAPVEAVLSTLGSGRQGLSTAQAEERRGRYGPNLLIATRQRSAVRRFLEQFNNVLLHVLLISGVVTAFLGEWVDSAVIIGVVGINAVIGFLQEGKAEKALEAIRDMLSPEARVIRDGRRRLIPASDLVPGDIVLVQAGDKVPADLRLLESKNLEIQEAVLTGESLAVAKSPGPVAPQAALAERSSMAFSGTLVVYGRGKGVVVATGMTTEIGRISSLLSTVEPLTTPLLAQIARFSRWLTAGILAVAAVTFALGTWGRGFAAADMFMAAVGLAVAAIPEGLPPVMTVTLAIGVARMARRQAIIRRLPAVETLGAVTVICTDKTGTLTRNELAVQTVVTAGHCYQVAGEDEAAAGAVFDAGAKCDPQRDADLMAAVRAALLCNDAELEKTAGHQVTFSGAPIDSALLGLAVRLGVDPVCTRAAWVRTDFIPFESDQKIMATLNHREGQGAVYVKGAPERILDMSVSQRCDGRDVALDRAYWTAQIDALARQAQRVIAIAMRPVPRHHRHLHVDDVRQGLTILAIVGLIDPPREGVSKAISACRQAGIDVKMITGDHALTAQAIAKRIGLGEGREVLTGPDIDRLDDDELSRRAGAVDVFARTTPEHKLRLVRALQTRDQVVAMTGDGVNDAPALKRADIGIAMGRKGTEAAREAAEMVLTDDNFATITAAVEEGRTVYDNLQKSILFLLPTSGGEALTIFMAVLFAGALPITPVQILWVNMVTAVTLGLALAFEAAEADIMKRPPRLRSAPILSGFLLWRIAFVSLLLLAGTFGLFAWERAAGASLAAARSVAVNALVVGEMVYLLNCRFIFAPAWRRRAQGRRNAAIPAALAGVFIFQLVFTYAPFMQALFQSQAVSIGAWGRIAFFGGALFCIVELEKQLSQRFGSG